MKLSSSKLRPGMIVKTPKWIIDGLDYTPPRKVPIAEYMGGGKVPTTMSVIRWDHAGGETYLRDPKTGRGLDANSADYPQTFEVVSTGESNQSKKGARKIVAGPRSVMGRMHR